MKNGKSHPIKYFIGKFRDGVTYRVMRSRPGRQTRLQKLLGKTATIIEQYTYKGWVKPKGEFRRVGHLLASRAAARLEKQAYEGRA